MATHPMAFEYRIYPDKAQRELLDKSFGCCRYVFNHVYDYIEDILKRNGYLLPKFECLNYLNRVLKPEHAWLREPDKFALQNATVDVWQAFVNYKDGRAQKPRHKCKRDNRKTYTSCITNNNIEPDYARNKIKLPKLGWVRARLHRQITGVIKEAAIEQRPSGKYFIKVIAYEEKKKLPPVTDEVGIDVGIKYFCITSDGEYIENPEFLQKYLDKIADLEEKLSNKVPGSHNYEDLRKRIAKLYEKVTGCRKDYIHKLTHKIISDNQVIVTESLDIIRMAQSDTKTTKQGERKKITKEAKKDRSRSVYDASWGEFFRQLKYKAEWYGRTFIQAGRYFPSSQQCSECGHKNPEVKDTSVREWDCPHCGAHHDRDINAAINILNEGKRLLAEDQAVSNQNIM